MVTGTGGLDGCSRFRAQADRKTKAAHDIAAAAAVPQNRRVIGASSWEVAERGGSSGGELSSRLLAYNRSTNGILPLHSQYGDEVPSALERHDQPEMIWISIGASRTRTDVTGPPLLTVPSSSNTAMLAPWREAAGPGGAGCAELLYSTR